MTRQSAAAIAALALAGCTTAPSLTVRPTGTTLVAGVQPASVRVAEAQAHLALGNVALAAEGFRKALRDDPGSVAALTGLASCYDRMGRFDLSRVHYERALALRPADSRIFDAFAGSLERSGSLAEAMGLRSEIAARGKAATPQVGGVAALVRAFDEEKSSFLAVDGRAIRVTALPVADPPKVQRSGPRLVRADLGEVVLQTAGTPQWRPLPVRARLARNAPPVRAQQAPVVRITILNAGTVEGAASRTRTRLTQHGWNGIAIANAGRQLERSELHYPVTLESEGRRLAKLLPVPVRVIRSDTVDRIVLRLGRDAGGVASKS